MSRASQLAMAIVLVGASAVAQTRMGAFGSGTLSRFGPRSFRMARPHHRFYPSYGYYGLPYSYSDYEPLEEYVPQPAPPPAPAPEVKVTTSADPELLELRDGQWVRVSNFSQASNHLAGKGAPSQQVSSKPLPPALLVFRDGHREEVSSYSIIGQTIYTKADYWKTGQWTRAIQLADLNIPDTLEKNRERGINFELPSSPDEIMIRP